MCSESFKRDEEGNLDMYVTNAFEQLFRGMMAAVGGKAGETPAGIHKGWMKVENVDVVGSRLGVLQAGLTADVLAGNSQGVLGMVFRAVNPLQAPLLVINLVPGLIARRYTIRSWPMPDLDDGGGRAFRQVDEMGGRRRPAGDRS